MIFLHSLNNFSNLFYYHCYIAKSLSFLYLIENTQQDALHQIYLINPLFYEDKKKIILLD